MVTVFIKMLNQQFEPTIEQLGGRFSLILFDGRNEFKMVGTHKRNNFLATRPGFTHLLEVTECLCLHFLSVKKDLFVIKKHLSDFVDSSIGFCLISTDEDLVRDDPLLSEGLRGTIETSIKWLFHAWKNHSIGPGYNTGALQILTHVTATGTPRSDGHYIISTDEL